jgi:hypothetical protein
MGLAAEDPGSAKSPQRLGRRRLFCQFIAEGQNDPCFPTVFRERFLTSRRVEVGVMWQRGVERGEIRSDIDREIGLDLIYGPVIFRLLTGHDPLNHNEAEAIVAAAFYGLRPRGWRRRRTGNE